MALLSESNYFAINVATSKTDEGIAIDVSLGVGVSIDLGMDRFGPGLPKATLEGAQGMGGTRITCKGTPTLAQTAAILEGYFKALKESAENRPVELPSERVSG